MPGVANPHPRNLFHKNFTYNISLRPPPYLSSSLLVSAISAKLTYAFLSVKCLLHAQPVSLSFVCLILWYLSKSKNYDGTKFEFLPVSYNLRIWNKYYLLYYFLENNLYFSFKLRKLLCVSNRLHGSYYFTFFSELLRQIYPKWNRCNRNIKENVEFCFCADVWCSLWQVIYWWHGTKNIIATAVDAAHSSR